MIFKQSDFNLGKNALSISGHKMCRRRSDSSRPRSALRWARSLGRHAEATTSAFDILKDEECAGVAKPEWWNDKELKALSARVVRAAPNDGAADKMRAVLWC